MTFIWTASFTNKPGNPDFCRASVSGREGPYSWLHSHQCTRKPTCTRIIDGKEYGFCKTHDPETVKARGKARDEQWRRECEAKNRAYDRKKQEREALNACKVAIEQIANGYNNARELAIEILKLFPEDNRNVG